MAVKRDRPDRAVPGELHTPDGRQVRITLPPGLRLPADVSEETAEEPRPEEPRDPRPPDAPPSGAA